MPRWRRIAVSGFAAFAIASGADAEDFYKGKTLTIVVGNAPGGGFDANARLLARHIGRHIPGNPNVIVVNMPGASGLTSVRYLDTTAPKDGTVIDHFNFGHIGESKLNPDRVRVDFRNFAWIGSIGIDISVCYVWHSIGAHGLAAVKAHGPLNFGETAPGSSSDINEKIAKGIFGLPIRQIGGYAGSADQRLAIERGELDGGCGAWGSLPADWIAGGKVLPFFKALPATQPGLPADVPYAGDLAPDARGRAIIRLLTASGELGRPFIASRAVPPDRLALLRAAFDATVKDPLFLADAEKLRLPVAPRDAHAAERIVAGIYDAPDEIVATARKLMAD